MPQPLEPIEGILAVLDSGSASGTNKFGLLLALIDLAPSISGDGFLDDRTLAAKLLEIHWDHAEPYGGHVLRQVTSSNRHNVVVIREVARLHAHLTEKGCPTRPFERVRDHVDPAAWEAALLGVIRATRANPLQKLQNLDRQQVTFLYEIERGGLRFRPQALDTLVRFGAALRDLVEFRFVRFVAMANRSTLGHPVEDDLAEHLFGVDRHMPPASLRRGLWELQGRRCLYAPATDVPLAATSLDHVVPWARVRISAIENLVLTTKPVNSAKSNLLLAPALVGRWVEHVGEHRGALEELAQEHGWPFDLARVTDVVGSLYRRAADGTATWGGPQRVVLLDPDGREEVEAALASVA